MSGVKLAVVIHAEEEFDWDAGFYRSNTQVTHTDALIELVDEVLRLNGKVTLAMDYPFVTSDGGRKVVDYYKSDSGTRIEFATHLHPWVSPPFENNLDKVSDDTSYPGNLPRDLEFEKLKVLTDTIETITGTRPKTYLAGRYGIGKHTQQILAELGYTLDLSISAYCDFTHQQGPDFSHYTNKRFSDNQITYLPHTSSILSTFSWLDRYLNTKPKLFTQIQSNILARQLGKVLRIRRYRLSPEGFTFEQMKRLTEVQLEIGQQEFVMSFHSPSVKPSLTPYTTSVQEAELLGNELKKYIEWIRQSHSADLILPQSLLATDRDIEL